MTGCSWLPSGNGHIKEVLRTPDLEVPHNQAVHDVRPLCGTSVGVWATGRSPRLLPKHSLPATPRPLAGLPSTFLALRTASTRRETPLTPPQSVDGRQNARWSRRRSADGQHPLSRPQRPSVNPSRPSIPSAASREPQDDAADCPPLTAEPVPVCNPAPQLPRKWGPAKLQQQARRHRL